VQVAPEPVPTRAQPPAAKAQPAPAAAASDGTDTWPLEIRQGRKLKTLVPKGQSEKFAVPDAADGQVGATSTFFGSMGLPLTFEAPNGDLHTVFALRKPLGLEFESRMPIKISEEKKGHGKELGVEIGWTLVGVKYQDITEMPFLEAETLLKDKASVLPEAMPLKFRTNNGELKQTCAYKKPLGITFPSKLPIKITEEKPGCHATAIGIKVGWELLEINYIDITKMNTFPEVMTILKREVTSLPSQP